MRVAFVALLSFALAGPGRSQLLIDDNHILQQGFEGAPGNREDGDFFGNKLAGGDFNGDGYADLAVASPGESNSRGLVTIFQGSPDGLLSEGATELRQDLPDVEGTESTGDGFGSALAAGDFDNDGFWDLAVGVPGEDGARGIVQVFYGAPEGLTGARDQVWSQSDLAGSGRDPNDFFGNSVAVGDFNGDGFDDLVIGSPGEALAAGVVHAMFGSASGLTTNGNQRWRQDADGIQGNREDGDLFGYELATGDFNHDGNDDLAVGVPGEDNGNGGVAVLFGTRGGGLRGDGNLFLAQGEDGIPDRRERNDAFGAILTAGDFNGDGFDELVIGSINEDDGRGVVIVLPGSNSGPTGNGSVDWRQGQRGLKDNQEEGDRFGTSLRAGDFNGDGFQDLAIGVRGEDNNRGIVQVIYGSASGLTATGNQLFQQAFEGLAGEASPGDDFGSALAVGNFGFDAAQDLAIGAPREEGNQDRGSVYAIYGFGLDIVSAGLSRPSVFEGSYNAILTAFGPNFAPAGTSALGRLVNGRVETNVGGVCVEMDGQRAPIFATFANQINFQASVTPDQRRSTVVIVSNCGAPSERRSLPIPLTILPAAPEFFFFVQNTDGRNPIAAIVNNTTQLLGPRSLGGAFRPARAGDVVTVFMTGLGDTSPRFAPGELPDRAGATVSPVTIDLGGRAYTPAYAGVTPGNAGLYQVSFVLNAGTPTGNLDLEITLQTPDGPVSTPPGAYLAVE